MMRMGTLLAAVVIGSAVAALAWFGKTIVFVGVVLLFAVLLLGSWLLPTPDGYPADETDRGDV